MFRYWIIRVMAQGEIWSDPPQLTALTLLLCSCEVGSVLVVWWGGCLRPGGDRGCPQGEKEPGWHQLTSWTTHTIGFVHWFYNLHIFSWQKHFDLVKSLFLNEISHHIMAVICLSHKDLGVVTAQYITVQYCTVLYCTVLYCTVLHSTELYSTVLYSTVL